MTFPYSFLSQDTGPEGKKTSAIGYQDAKLDSETTKEVKER